MREILFRAKKTFNGEWVEGYYEFGYSAETEEPTHYMWVLNHTEKYGEMFMVIPETVGQYTGLTDKNGKKIFEGDIVESISDLVNLRGKKSGKKITKFYEIVVTADNSSFTYGTREIGETYISRTIYKENAQRFYSVIGNIHDNPELLKGGK